MHLGVDASRLLRDRRGMGRSVRNILRWLPRLRPSLRITLYVKQARDIEPLREYLATIDSALRTHVSYATWDALPDSDADVVWYPWNWITQPTHTAPMVVSIYDIAPMLLLDGRWWKVLKRWRARRLYAQTLEYADRVLACSTFTSQELVRSLHADPDRLRVTLLASDDFLPSPQTQSDTLDRLHVDGPYFLTVGAHDARKNLSTLYRAMEILHARGERVPLVQCSPGQEHGRYPFVKFAGFVEDQELATLYRRATALVFPSRYEGFGLPVAEAMSTGGRVVCADASSLPEVVGDAALLFPWDDAEALASQLTRMLHDAALRDQLTQAGLEQSKKFTWSETARQTLNVFDEAALLRHR